MRRLPPTRYEYDRQPFPVARKYGRAVVVGMQNRTLMPVLSVSRKRPPDKLPPGIKETTDPAVTAIGVASPLLAISLRRPKSNEMLSQDRRQAALELAL